MEKTIVIENSRLCVKISTLGAEIVSIKKDGEEQLWCGNPEIWGGHAPILFPVCGGLNDGKIIYNDREYEIEKHGYAKTSFFEAEKHCADSAGFLLKSDELSKSKYPFDYEFRVGYSLTDTSLKVEFFVKNTGDGDMFYSVGAHEGYACPGGIENYDIVFECEENLETVLLENGLLGKKTLKFGENITEFPLKKEYFELDTLIFTALKSRRVSLRNKISGKEIKIDFTGADNLLLWTDTRGDFLCVEPWCGLPDYYGECTDISRKPGMNRVSAGKEEKRTHIITF